MADHTPGPWVVVGGDEDGRYIAPQDTPGTICHLFYIDDDQSLVDFRNSEANARLIAAAPDLLEALQKIDDWLVCACIASAEDMAQSFPDMQKVAAIAIARATGEK